MSELRMVWEMVYDFCLTLGAASAGILAVFFHEGIGGLSGDWWIPFMLWFACGVLLITSWAKQANCLLKKWRERSARGKPLSLTERILRESSDSGTGN